MPTCWPVCPQPEDVDKGATFNGVSKASRINSTIAWMKCEKETASWAQFFDETDQKELTCQDDHTWSPAVIDLPRCTHTFDLNEPKLLPNIVVEKTPCKHYQDDESIITKATIK
ncbi:unnamed protein product [Meganyctiphanes norvegica]|uniref:Sushi domain-containing protein n=1 Tax=Meganyctiphanes norvegica TaxID=48144 RepID=A0AAV2PQA5_MEGNR